MGELKKCPFCGSEAIIYEDHEYNDAYMVGCKGFCKLEPMTEWCKTKEEAIAQWNTRNPMERIVKKLGASSIMLATSKEYWENPQKGGNTMEVIPIQDAIKIVKEELN